MESKQRKTVKANLSFVKDTAKKAVNQIKSSPEFDKITLDDIEALDMDVVQGDVSKEVKDAIRGLIIAYLYLDKCGIKHVTERLRPGFIGMETKDTYTVTQQVSRGAPYGTLVSIPGLNGKSTVGISYYDEIGRFATPIRSEYIALKKALLNKERGINGTDKESLRKEAKSQFEHFYKRSLAYWNPDKYSYSRGSEPVEYENFDKIHENQTKILGEQKMKTFATRLSRTEIGALHFVSKIESMEDIAKLMARDVKDGDFYICTTSMTLEPNDNFPTKTKSALVLADKDWLVFSKGRWDVIYISEPHIEQAINNILNKTE
jgi:hypothetical protein